MRVAYGSESEAENIGDVERHPPKPFALDRTTAAERNIRIGADLTSAACPGSRDRLTQVATNLLTNAIKYNHDGGEVSISTRAYEGVTSLEVANTGPGISAEDLPQIFDRFYRADKARTASAGHSGLGLAIVKAIVQAHGGTITATSAPGRGAIFTVRLPC